MRQLAQLADRLAQLLLRILQAPGGGTCEAHQQPGEARARRGAAGLRRGGRAPAVCARRLPPRRCAHAMRGAPPAARAHRPGGARSRHEARGRGHLLDELLVGEQPGACASTATGRPSRTRLVRSCPSSSLDTAAVRVDERTRVPDRVAEDEAWIPDDPGEHVSQPSGGATGPARRPTVRPTRGRVAPAPSPGDRQREPESAAAWPSHRRRSSGPVEGTPIERHGERHGGQRQVDGAGREDGARRRRGSNESQRRRGLREATPRRTPGTPPPA